MRNKPLKFERPNLIVPVCYPRGEKIEVLDTQCFDINKKSNDHKLDLNLILDDAKEKMDKLIKRNKADAAVLVFIENFKDRLTFHVDLIKVLTK